jgi:hypothetical protein
MHAIKQQLKAVLYPYWFKQQYNAPMQVAQANFKQQVLLLAAQNKKVDLNQCGFKVFSQFEEDGLILACIAALNLKSQTALEIGSNNCVNSNIANLVLNHNWLGCFIDGDKSNLTIGEKFYNKVLSPWQPKPQFKKTFVTAENINQIVSEFYCYQQIDVLSIDIDGNDYWIWNALEIIKPTIVIIETHVEFGLNNIVVPYNANYKYPGIHKHYHGASPVAMQKLGHKKGYKLVGANALGFNQIYVLNSADKLNILPEIKVEQTLLHPDTIKSFDCFEAIKHFEYLTP